jgi:hypothetical protein
MNSQFKLDSFIGFLIFLKIMVVCQIWFCDLKGELKSGKKKCHSLQYVTIGSNFYEHD